MFSKETLIPIVAVVIAYDLLLVGAKAFAKKFGKDRKSKKSK